MTAKVRVLVIDDEEPICRMLRNVLERAVILAAGEDLGPDLLPEELRAVAPVQGGHDTLEAAGKRHVATVLARSRTLDAAARTLGIDPSTLYRQRQRHGLL